jgi:4-diphosphocytidyl-2-C-methyl-D-erythritol kinase
VSPTLGARAPAKVNLGLRILGRRPDGLHELESLFAPLDLADELELHISGSGGPRVRLRDAGGAFPAPGPPNLAVQAAEAFLARAGCDWSVEIRLAKHVPLAAGLGGGSSDAGSVLRALAGHAPGVVPADELVRLARALGADVPFFLDPRPAWVGGIGERIEPCPELPRLALLLVNPGFALSTAEVYRAFDALGPWGPPPPRPSLTAALAGGEALAALLHNDLEAPARRLRPELGALRRRLEALGPWGVGMSGSGPTLFAVFEGPEQAARALAEGGFGPPCWARVARTGEAG